MDHYPGDNADRGPDWTHVYFPAVLSQDELQRLQSLERYLSAAHGRPIVVVAYEMDYAAGGDDEEELGDGNELVAGHAFGVENMLDHESMLSDASEFEEAEDH